MEITHAVLVRVATVWLQQNHTVVATEITTAVNEIPDAIGFKNYETTVVECKTSKTDFIRNSKKTHERGGYGVGNKRWFLVPKGLVSVDEVPEGWGLLEYRESGHVRGYYIKIIVAAPRQEGDFVRLRQERLMLISIARRALEAVSQVKPLTLGCEEEEEGTNE